MSDNLLEQFPVESQPVYINIPDGQLVYLGDHNNNGVGVTNGDYERLYFTLTSTHTSFKAVKVDSAGFKLRSESPRYADKPFVRADNNNQLQVNGRDNEGVVFKAQRIKDLSLQGRTIARAFLTAEGQSLRSSYNARGSTVLHKGQGRDTDLSFVLLHAGDLIYKLLPNAEKENDYAPKSLVVDV